MKGTKRIVSLLLTLGILLTSIPAAAFEKPSNAESALQNGYAPTEDKYAIYPIPRSVAYASGDFTLGTQVTVVSESGIDNYTNQFLDEILSDYDRTKTTSQTVTEGTNRILLGIKGSGGAVDAWADSHLTLSDPQLFTKTDAYLLSADNGTIVILGKDTNAVYYGLATLQMMFSSFNGSKFLNAQIEDYAGMKMRGFIEGFYGGWNNEGRESLMRFARDVKMNTYIYASKTDSYHKNDELYPTDQINQIRELVRVGDETKVKYCWSIHLSYFFNSLPNDIQSQEYQTKFNEKFERLKTKFQQLYDAGVRKFAILNDDFGSGSHSEVVRLLNKLDNEFLVPKGCDNLSYCMQGYNKGWSGDGTELREMVNLNESIDLFWTGDDVNSPITQETIDYVKENTGHEAVFWLNYPVNEHAKSGIYLGEISHYVRDDVTGLAGAVSNPCVFTEANKVGLFQLGALFWNNHNYLAQAETIWEESFKYLQPEVYESYLTIARNVANCPGSGRVPAGFPESEYIKDSLEAITEKIKKGRPISEDENTQRLIDEFAKMQTAVDTFRTDCANEVLKTDLNSWLNSLNDVATAGEAVLKSLTAMESGDLNEAWSNLGIAGAAMSSWNTYPSYENNMAQAGSKRLVPFINKALATAKRQILPLVNPKAEILPSYFALIHGKDRTDSTEFAKAYDGSDSTFASFHDGTQQAGDHFGIDLGKATPIHSIDILQASSDSDNDFFHNAILEYSDTGEDDDWTEILKYENDDAPRRIEKTYADGELTTRFIRLRTQKRGTANKPDYWTHIREITINGGETTTKEPSYGLYASENINASVTLDALTYSITDTSVSLPPEGYIGIKMEELSAIDTVVCDIGTATGLTFQYSVNGLIWTNMPDNPNGKAARYVRLYNETGQTANITINALSVTALAGAVDPYLFSNSPELNTLHEGAIENMFDGKNDTFAWFEPAIKKNFELVIDFGTVAPIYDIAITNESGNPKFYDAEIYLSTDNSNWGSPVITIANSNSEHLTTEGKFMTFSRDDLQGRSARYMKILITKDSPNQVRLKINEIAVNKTVSSSEEPIKKIETNSLTGALDQMIDGDISTAYISSQPSDGTAYIKYPLTEDMKMTSITFLQNATEITNAEVKAEIYDGQTITEEILGALDGGITTFYRKGDKDILSLTVTWPENTIPALYEIITTTGETMRTISFSGEGAPQESLLCPENRFIILPDSAVEKEGYLFKGWSDGTAIYPPNKPYTMGSADITLNAVWVEDVKVTSVSVSPAAAELQIGETKDLQFTVLPENAAVKTVTWSSDNPSIATVNEKSGKVKALTAGTTKIKATSQDGSNKSGECVVTVKPILVESITVSPKSKTLKTGESVQLSYTIAPENAANQNVTWSSSDDAIASIDPNTKTVTAHAVGNAVITATSEENNEISDSCSITVIQDSANPDLTPVQGISVSPKTKTLKPDESFQIKETVTPSDATNKNVIWSSSDNTIASIDPETKTVTAHAVGNAIITATSEENNEISDSCSITVSDSTLPNVEVQAISVSPKKNTIIAGKSITLSATITPDNAANKNLIWRSSNRLIASVDEETGEVSAHKKGTVTITATSEENPSISDNCTVEVIEADSEATLVTSITVTPQSHTMKAGDSITLTKTVLPADATNPNVAWDSNDTDVASVDPETGKVTALAKGSAVITARALDGSGIFGVCAITVTDSSDLPQDYKVELSPKSKTLYVNGTVTLKAAILPETVGTKELVWASDRPSVAKVDQNGVVKAYAKGTATITASSKEDDKIFDTCTITVTEKSSVKMIKVTSVSVSPRALNLTVNASKTLKAALLPSNASNKTVKWTSKNPKIASVDSRSGIVKAVSAGQTTITATAQDGSKKFGFCTVTVTPEPIQQDKTYEVENFKYTVTSLKDRTVTLTESLNKNLQKITPPNTIQLQNITYTVTAIGKGAFKNHKKATTATLGANILSIGDSAFEGCAKLKKATIKSAKLNAIGKKAFQKCKKLKTITIKSLKLKNIGKNAFKGIHKKATIKVPAKKLKNYKKYFKKTGQPKTVRIKK